MGDSSNLPPGSGSARRSGGNAASGGEASSPAVAAFEVGSVVAGKYKIERVIGDGGLGVVVAAEHLQLDQRVAIKYLLPATLKKPMLVERFLREGRLAARIKSEHVVRIYDVETLPSGVPYMVMEYLAGSDLRSVLRDGPIAGPDAVDYLLQACEALAEAHAAGIVHRDLKPENFFLAFGPGGTTSIKILDFGISKLTVDDTRSDGGRPLTTDTDKFGTPAYMSPEQLKASGKVDRRADIWSLGVVLFELLTGRRPFDGESYPEVCTSIMTAEPLPLRDVLPEASAAIETVIIRCLEKSPDKRFQDVGELSQVLAIFGLEESSRRGHHIRRVVAGAGLRKTTPGSNLRLPTPGGYIQVPQARDSSPAGAPASGVMLGRLSSPRSLGRIAAGGASDRPPSSPGLTDRASSPAFAERAPTPAFAERSPSSPALTDRASSPALTNRGSSPALPDRPSAPARSEQVSSSGTLGRALSTGTLGVVARDATAPSLRPPAPKQRHVRSAVVLAMTSLVSVAAAVAVMSNPIAARPATFDAGGRRLARPRGAQALRGRRPFGRRVLDDAGGGVAARERRLRSSGRDAGWLRTEREPRSGPVGSCIDRRIDDAAQAAGVAGSRSVRVHEEGHDDQAIRPRKRRESV